ncbi:MAG TPA: class I SAM-dependent methyltransferase [Candidatus Eisenbacteria bacterium]|nr:class I SAM-dependent methyltransferase [Candidatus Eisenbacteria bacterium]
MGKPEQSWGHFYADSGTPEYYRRHVEIHKTFLDRVEEGKPRRVLEAGCGSGIMSVYFSKKGIETTALDRDREVLAKAKQSGEALGGRAVYREGNIFKLPFSDGTFDAAFSQGVLEHFSDDDIRRAVREQLRVARRVWISVPSKYYNHRDFGDERLLTDKEWKKILEGTGKVGAEYYFYLRVKRNFLIRRPLMLLVDVSR